MPAEEPVDPAIFDAVQFEIVQRLILPERLRVHLDELDRQMHALVGASGQILQERAHKIISQAGMLGLMRLSDRARAVENACQTGDDVSVALLECYAAGHDVRLYAVPAIRAKAA
ncbi:Hpt domain-containing protein [Sphingomonas sp.]|uniref:Hpt domain-containing protein n=1 Tax=Sphingomonas sp. TaxID=28214 RepID=UPI00286DCCE4|nr:Hpt domain-containing protein [Sphingomonas sp.]